MEHAPPFMLWWGEGGGRGGAQRLQAHRMSVVVHRVFHCVLAMFGRQHYIWPRAHD